MVPVLMVTLQPSLASSDPDGISMPTAKLHELLATLMCGIMLLPSHAAVTLTDILCVTCHTVLNVRLGLGCYDKSSLFTSTFYGGKKM